MHYSTFVKSISFMLLLALLFGACKKEEINPNDPQQEEEIIEEEEEKTNVMTAKVDGADWEASRVLVTMKDGVINITGVSEDDREITITVQSDAEGEYELNLVSSHVALYTPVKNSNDIFSSNGDSSAGGQVIFKTIDMSDKHLSGTFDFKGVQPGETNSVDITEGVFTKVKIQ
ncbi:MAG: DUF6252 family protein [Bacteroidota bacterium]